MGNLKHKLSKKSVTQVFVANIVTVTAKKMHFLNDGIQYMAIGDYPWVPEINCEYTVYISVYVYVQHISVYVGVFKTT